MSRLENVFDSSWTPPSALPTPLQSSSPSSSDDDTSNHEDAASALTDPELSTAREHHDNSDTLVHPSSDTSTEVADKAKAEYRHQDPIDDLDDRLKNLQIARAGDRDIQHTPLHLAVDDGRADIVQTLLDSDHIDINAKRRPDNSSWTPPSPLPTPLQSSSLSSFDDDSSNHEDAASALTNPELSTACEHHDNSDTLVHPSSDRSTEVADKAKPEYRLQDSFDELDGRLKNLQIARGGDRKLEAYGGASKRPHPNQLQTDQAKRVHMVQSIVIVPRDIEGGFSNVISRSSFPRFNNRIPPFVYPVADTLPTSVDTDGAEAKKEISRIEAEIIALGEATSPTSLIMTSRGTGQQSTFGPPDFEQLTTTLVTSPRRVTGVAGPPASTRSSSLHQKEVLLPPTHNSGSRSVQRSLYPLPLSPSDIAPRSGELQTQLGVCNPPQPSTRARNYSGSSAGSLSPSDVTLRNHSARSVARGQSDITMRSPASQLRSSSQDVTFTVGNDDGEDDGNPGENLPQCYAFLPSSASHPQRSSSSGFISSGSSSHSSSSASLSSEYSGSSGSERNSGTELNFLGPPSGLSKLKGSNCSIASACSSQLDSGIEGDSPGQSPQGQSPVQSPHGQATRAGDFPPAGPPPLWTHARIGTRNSMEGISEETSRDVFPQHCTSGPQSLIGRRSLSSSSDKSSTSSPVTSTNFREPLESEGTTCAGMTVCSPPSYAQGYRNQQSPCATSPAQYNLPPTPVSPDGNASSPSTVDSIYSHSPNIYSPEASSPNVPNLSIITDCSIPNHTTVTSPPSSSASLTLNCGHPEILTQSPTSVGEHFSPQSQTSPGDRHMVMENSSYSPTVTARSPQGSVFMASSPQGSVGVTNSPCGSVLMANSPAHYRTEVKSPTYPPAVSPSQMVISQMMNSPRINSPPVYPPQMNSPSANYQGMNSPMVSSTTCPQGIVDYSYTDPDKERGSESPMMNLDCWSSPATPEAVQELSPEELERLVIGKDGKWIRDLHGETYLHALSGLDDEDMCTHHLFWLHGKGQFIQALNAYNTANETPLYSAVMFNKPKLTAAFMQVGADVNCQCQTGMHDIQHTPLHLAVDDGRVDIVQTLLDSDHININAKRRPDNQTPLMVALRAHRFNDRTRIIDMLLKAAPDLECKELTHQKTALMMAIETKDLNVVRLILESAGVENTRRLINQNKNGSGNTAMHLAAGHNISPQIQSVMLRLLIQYGGDTDVKNSEGATPKDYAKMVIEKVSTRR